MRAPRNRRQKRLERPFPKPVYHRAAVKIQRGFRAYILRRYQGICSNFNDDDCILLNSVAHIPRDVVVIIENTAFDSRSLLTWMARSNSNPLTRKPLPEGLKESCFEKAVLFLHREEKRNSNRRGFYSRKRVLRRTVDRHRRLCKSTIVVH